MPKFLDKDKHQAWRGLIYFPNVRMEKMEKNEALQIQNALTPLRSPLFKSRRKKDYMQTIGE